MWEGGDLVEIFGILEAGVQGGAVRTRTPPTGLGCPGAGWEDRGLGVLGNSELVTWSEGS